MVTLSSQPSSGRCRNCSLVEHIPFNEAIFNFVVCIPSSEIYSSNLKPKVHDHEFLGLPHWFHFPTREVAA